MASNKTVLTSAQKAKRSHAFGSELAERPHSLTREVDDLRKDIEAAFLRTERNLAGPVITNNDLAFEATANTLKSGGNIYGTGLLCGQSQASVTLGKITYTVRNPGVAGNAFSVEVVAGAGALSTAFADNKLTVTLAGAGSTNNAIAANINAKEESVIKFTADVIENGGDAAAVAASTAATGGVGAGIDVHIYSIAEDKSLVGDALSISDTKITLKTATTALNAVTTGHIQGIAIEDKDNSTSALSGSLSNISQSLPATAN